VRRTLEILNELEREGVFSRYAIGGAMAATFYTEPVLTFGLDVFVLLSASTGKLVSLAPIYEALRARGYGEEKETVVIEGVPVQFLPAYNALIEETVAQAREIDYEGVPARVAQAEHLNLFADRASKGSRASGNAARTGSPRSRATCRYSEATST
jgi:hypothetical protein